MTGSGDIPDWPGCTAGCAPHRQRLRARRSAAEGSVQPDSRDMGAEAGVLPVATGRPGLDLHAPPILLRTTPQWRADCLGRVAHIPSGYTYLAQLMGHDIGSSVSAETVPYARSRAAQDKTAPPRRYNLIDNPLTLEAIYGPGPTMLAHVYDPETWLFRLTPGARLARIYARGLDALSDPDPQPIRALYDERNRDSLMLHELAVAVMQFHNLCARPLLGAGETPLRAYVLARGHVLRCWHDILLDDLLPRLLHPVIAARDAATLPPEWELDETSLLHGLCRTFHALPLAAYPLGRSGLHNLRALLKRGYAISEAEAHWQIDWPLFFGARPDGPMTGISASVAPELRAPVSAAAIIALDESSAREAGALCPGDDAVQAAVASLPDDWPRRLTPARLAADFNTTFADSPLGLDARALEWGPLYQFLMVEAQLYGERGGFGPLGSALLRGSVSALIGRVVVSAQGQDQTGALPRPRRMLDLIRITGDNDRREE